MSSKIVHLSSVHHTFETRIFHKMCRSLKEAGLQVTLITPHLRDETVQGVQIIAVPPVKRRLYRMTVTGLQIYRKAVELKADLYHFHDPELIPFGLLLRIGGYRVIYDIHEDYPRALLSTAYYYLRSPIRPLMGWAMEKLENMAARHFNACVAATPAIAARFRKIQPQTMAVNNFPILAEMAQPADIKWSNRANAIAYVGTISLDRGLRQMVEAMEHLPSNLEARLKLGGTFPQLEDHLDTTKTPGWQYVDELGFLDRQGVARLLAQVRAGLVLLHPEYNHMVAQPVKLFEYMCAGIPVIASDFPLWRELIEREQCGLVVDPLDPGAIARAIEYLLTHPREAERMGQKGRAAVERLYNWSVESRKLLSVYKSVLNSPNK